MAEFRCIGCGAVKESEKSCSCPVCGYKMLKTPYEREQALRQEIRDFLRKLRLTEVTEDSLEFFREAPLEETDADDGKKKAKIIPKSQMISDSLTIKRFRDMFALRPRRKCSSNG